MKNADILYLKSSWAFKHSNPLKGSPGSHSQLASSSVDIMSSCSMLTFHSRSASLITSTLPLLLSILNL